MSRVTRLALTLTAAPGFLCLGVTGSASADPQPAPATTTVYFNDPVAGVPAPGAPSAVTAAVVALLDRTYSASTVNIAMYQWNNVPPVDVAVASAWPRDAEHNQPEGTDVYLIAQAIQNAADSGAHVNIVMDDGDFNNGVLDDWLKDVPRVTVRQCVGSCYRGPNGGHVMHNKFMIVDKALVQPRAFGGLAITSGVVTDSDIVLQMTSNWTNAQLDGHFFNSAVQFTQDEGLYDAYLAYWTGLDNCAKVPTVQTCGTQSPVPSPVQSLSGSRGETASAFPRSSASSDPIKSVLNRIDCSLTSPTLVDIAMNQWDSGDNRGDGPGGIEDILTDMRDDGCVVRIVIPYDPSNVTILPVLKRDFPETTHCSDNESSSLSASLTTAVPAVHSKYMLISGSMDGVAGTRMVYTGSETFKEEARAFNDNAWVSLAVVPGNNGFYSQYEANFEHIWNSTPLCASVVV